MGVRCHGGIHGCTKEFLLSELKNEKLEHKSYRQDRNFINRERLRGDTHNRVQKLGPSPSLSPGVWNGDIYKYISLHIYIYIYTQTHIYVRLPP
jgi:hypothetical protein